MKISIVSPVYKSECIVQELVSRITNILIEITEDYEIILVDDGSPDNSWIEIESCCQQNNKTKGVKLSRNFGQHAAIFAGLNQAKGEWIVVMDCDLQDRPDEIPNLYKKAMEGFDIVFVCRENRTDGILKKTFSKWFYRALEYLTDTKQDPSIANFGIYNRKVINTLLTMRDYIKYFPSMVKWVGFKSTQIWVKHGDRFQGESSYSFHKLLQLGINVILSFSDKPLRLAIKGGLLMSTLTLIGAITYFIIALINGFTVEGYASLIISTWLLSGIVISFIGMLGLYIGKIFDQVKERPVYIISEIVNE